MYHRYRAAVCVFPGAYNYILPALENSHAVQSGKLAVLLIYEAQISCLYTLISPDKNMGIIFSFNVASKSSCLA